MVAYKFHLVSPSNQPSFHLMAKYASFLLLALLVGGQATSNNPAGYPTIASIATTSARRTVAAVYTNIGPSPSPSGTVSPVVSASLSNGSNGPSYSVNSSASSPAPNGGGSASIQASSVSGSISLPPVTLLPSTNSQHNDRTSLQQSIVLGAFMGLAGLFG